jgi:2-furoyl-CoA dehydrogenase FAD binding subunit
MKPAPFDLVIAHEWEEALDTLARHGEEAQVLAGGQSLVAMLNMRLAKPTVLVDINRVTGADRIEPGRNCVRIGAALEGEVELVRRKGRRVVAATDFFTGLLSTAREADEVVAGVRYPTARPDRGYAFSEIAERHGDFALASFAAIAGEGFVRLAVGAAADRPVARTWSTTDLDELADALNDFAWDLGGIDDPHASARYRRDLVRTQGKATIAAALHRAGLLGSREPLRGAAT